MRADLNVTSVKHPNQLAMEVEKAVDLPLAQVIGHVLTAITSTLLAGMNVTSVIRPDQEQEVSKLIDASNLCR